jgi:NAD(P)-dependent dehydrogenase (short-subunit alcohol dehydrogenase family)
VGLDLEADPDRDIVACDVTDDDAVARAVPEAIEKLGGLDVLVNNAGLGFSQSAAKAPDDQARKVLEVNLLAPWRVTAAALPALLESPGRGRVVNVSSGLAYLTVPFAPAYTMSKRGVAAYSDSLRLEYGDRIDVTTVYPGYIKTPIHQSSEEDGFALNGVVPEESLDDAAAAMARAVTCDRPPRDLATTRRGGVQLRLLRHVPRKVVDQATSAYMRQIVRRGAFSRSELAADYVQRIRGN